MHTIKPDGKLYDVTFETDSGVARSVIKGLKDFDTAAKWVNYLNGGPGHLFDHCITVQVQGE